MEQGLYGLVAKDPSHSKKLLTPILVILDPFRTFLAIVQVAATFAPIPYIKDAIGAALFLIDCAQVRISIDT